MGKTKKTNGFETFYNELTDMHKTNQDLVKKNKEFERQTKELVKMMKDFEKKNKELENKLQRLEDQKDINNELSENAQFAIKVSKGPFKPNELQKFLISDACLNHTTTEMTMTAIREYSNDIDGVKGQLLWVHVNAESYIMHREEQNELDGRLIKTIKQLQKAIEEDEKDHLDDKAISPASSNSDNMSNKTGDGNCTKKRKLTNKAIKKLHKTIGEGQEDLEYSAKSPDKRDIDNMSNNVDDGTCTTKRKFMIDDNSQPNTPDNGEERYVRYKKERSKPVY